MSRYIDVDEINANYIKLKEKRGVEYPSPRRILSMTLQAIDMCNTADVVSREQYNLLYEECLRLRTLNEQLMDSLREKEDDGK